MDAEILEIAKKLYLEGNSIREVARNIYQIYGLKIGIETIRANLHGLIKLRTRKEAMTLKRGNVIPDEEVVRLYMEGKSPNQIAKLFNAGHSGVKYILVKNHVKLRNRNEGARLRFGKYEKPAFRGTEEDKAYLIGITLGDVSVRYASNFTIEANTATTHEAMIQLLVETFGEHTDGIDWYPDPEKGFRFTAYLDKSFDFLIAVKRNVELIRNFSRQEFIAFLAGFFDAEGCIVIKNKRRKSKSLSVKIGNTNKSILEIIKEMLHDVGIESRVYLYSKKGKYHDYRDRRFINRKDYYVLEVARKHDYEKLLQEMPIRHLEKIVKRDQLLKLTGSSFHAS